MICALRHLLRLSSEIQMAVIIPRESLIRMKLFVVAAVASLKSRRLSKMLRMMA